MASDGAEATGILINGSNQLVYREFGSNAFTSTSYANTALSNLATVAINTSLLPGANDSIDLGDDTHRWANLFLGGETIHIGASTADEYTLDYNATSNKLGFNVNGSGDPEITFDGSGNVGIGTTTPTSRLSVSAPEGENAFAIGNSIYKIDGDGVAYTGWLTVTQGIQMDQNHATMYINYNNYGVAANGLADGAINLGSGTHSETANTNKVIYINPIYNQDASTASNTDLLINRTETSLGSGAQYLISAGTGGASYASKFFVSNAGQGYFAGNVGIGTTTPASNTLQVTGSAGKTVGGTAWSDLSDVRLKNILGDVKGAALQKIFQLHPVRYEWNSLHESLYGPSTDTQMYGFAAQEIKDVIPEFVSMSPDGYYWYNPSGFEAILTAGIQEQQEQIGDLQTQNSNLENQNQNLNLKTDQNVNTVQELQTAVNDKLTLVGATLTDQQEQIADYKSRITQAETKLQEDENNLITFEAAVNDTLRAMLETENMLTDRVLSHEDRIKALEDKIATMSCRGGRRNPLENVVTQDKDGNV